MSARILVVEDNPSNMTLFAWTLEDAGYDFKGVERAEDGLELLGQEQFDLVLMDLSLPGIDGLEATRRIRATPSLAAVPVIAVTAHVLANQTHTVFEAGVDELVIKPVEERELLIAIERQLQAS